MPYTGCPATSWRYIAIDTEPGIRTPAKLRCKIDAGGRQPGAISVAPVVEGARWGVLSSDDAESFASVSAYKARLLAWNVLPVRRTLLGGSE